MQKLKSWNSPYLNKSWSLAKVWVSDILSIDEENSIPNLKSTVAERRTSILKENKNNFEQRPIMWKLSLQCKA